jgi:hypothetical protein
LTGRKFLHSIILCVSDFPLQNFSQWELFIIWCPLNFLFKLASCLVCSTGKPLSLISEGTEETKW